MTRKRSEILDLWVCSICGRKIATNAGYVVVADADTGGYPRRPTPNDIPLNEAGKAREEEARAAGKLTFHKLTDYAEVPAQIRFSAMHAKCDPDPVHGSEYWIDVDRARTLECWVAWVLHVGSKVWMGKRDLRRILRFWYLNRGLREPRA